MQKARWPRMTWRNGLSDDGNRAALTGGRLPVKAKSLQGSERDEEIAGSLHHMLTRTGADFLLVVKEDLPSNEFI